MITYRDLQTLENNCLILLHNYVSAPTAEDEDKIQNAKLSLLHAIRNITIAVEFRNIQIISISGLQGSGKSTMMQTFFALPDGLLKVSTNRGEQIPILISEREDCHYPEPRVVYLEHDINGYERISKPVSTEDFIRYSSGAMADKESVIYLELHLPYRRICDPGLAFMLLPGFEDKQDYWKHLIDFSLSCSDSSIFMFDQARYSKLQNKEILDKVKEAFSDSMIYAISRCDLTGETADTFREKCIRDLGVQEDRVINVGTFTDDEKNEEWISLLTAAVNRYCNSGRYADHRTDSYILETIDKEILPPLALIREILNREKDIYTSNRLEHEDALSAFDAVVARKRRKLERSLKKSFRNAEEKACSKLLKIYTDKEYARSLKVEEKPLVYVRRTILGEKVKDKIAARDRLREAMTDDEDRILFFQKAFAEAVSMSLEDWSPENSKGGKFILEGINPYKQKTSEENTRIVSRQIDLLHDAKLLLSEELPQEELLRIGDIKKTCECIADMAEEYLNVYALSEIYHINKNSMDDLPLDNLHVDLKTAIEKGNNLEKVILSGLGITGADLLGDGVLNFVPGIAQTFNLSVSAVGFVVSAIFTVGAGGAIIRDINRLQMTEQSAGETKIREISLETQKEYLDEYDNAMSLIRERIAGRLDELEGNSSQTGNRINALGAVNKIAKQINEIRSSINAQPGFLRNAFR